MKLVDNDRADVLTRTFTLEVTGQELEILASLFGRVAGTGPARQLAHEICAAAGLAGLRPRFLEYFQSSNLATIHSKEVK